MMSNLICARFSFAAGVGTVGAECICVGGSTMDSRVRRRTKSLGALRQGGQVNDPAEGHHHHHHMTGGTSQTDSGTNSGVTLRGLTASSQFLPYLFSNQSSLGAVAAGAGNVRAAEAGMAGLNHQERAALFASYPSVKCDIVEYL